MRRNLELIRTILLEIEANSDPTRPFKIQAAGYDPVEVEYHVKLLREAGYVVAVDLSTSDSMDYRPKSLTWQGHEFLDAAKNDSVWRQARAKLKDAGVDAPLSVIQQLVIKIAATALGLDA